MQVQLFGVGVKSLSPAITAQRRINCFVDVRQHGEKTAFSLVGRRGLTLFANNGLQTMRGMWAVNTLTVPLCFFVQDSTLYSVNNSGSVSTIGNINTSTGNVSMVDNGTFLVFVDGTSGYYYNMISPAGINQIVDGNFTTNPGYVTFQDTYFIVTSNKTNQFQLSANADPTTWPAVNINFTSSPAPIQACISNHSVLHIFGQDSTEFWQNTGSPDFPFAIIPSASQPFGLASPWSLSSFENTTIGLFRNKVGKIKVGMWSGFQLRPVSNQDIDTILDQYVNVSDAKGYSFDAAGHQFYILNLPSAGQCWQFDGQSQIWSEVQATDGSAFWADKSAFLVNNTLVNDRRNGNIYLVDGGNMTDAGSLIPMEVWTQHIWREDKYIGISKVQIDMEQGTGSATGQGVNPVMDLQVSKDGGNSFRSIGYSSIGPVGQYTQRTTWNSLGGARDWVLRLRITDPVKRVITGATAELTNASF